MSRIHKYQLNCHNIEQVRTFKYFGIVFPVGEVFTQINPEQPKISLGNQNELLIKDQSIYSYCFKVIF